MESLAVHPQPLAISTASTATPASTPTPLRRPPPLQSATSSEYYGFALLTFSTVLWTSWIIWALVPQHILEGWGVLWMPSREWAYLLPAWSMGTMLFGYAAYNAINIMNTAGPHDLHSFVDEHSNVGMAGRDMPYGVISRRICLLPEEDLDPALFLKQDTQRNPYPPR
ncbi:hypothetical protein CF326_g2528 [Tilletia indica]|nr:hypothetical protein CF326_g2528 [Tilletia indica]